MITDQMKAEGWIEHDGGRCPVPPNVITRALVRTSANEATEPEHSQGTLARDWHWEIQTHLIGAILAYKPGGTSHDH